MRGKEVGSVDMVEVAMNTLAEDAIDEFIPAVKTVLATWQPPDDPSDVGDMRRRLLTLPSSEAYVPLLSDEGVKGAFAEISKDFGTADWSVVHSDNGFSIEPGGETYSHQDIEEERAEGFSMLSRGCSATLVRALAAALDDNGFLVGELNECMIPNTPASQAAFDLYLAGHDGNMVDHEFLRAVLREVKRTLPEGMELPKALAEEFPRRPVG